MPVARAHLRLEPDGFFDRNPALDVPPPNRHANRHCH
jgi:primary-amine oxidase